MYDLQPRAIGSRYQVRMTEVGTDHARWVDIPGGMDAWLKASDAGTGLVRQLDSGEYVSATQGDVIAAMG